jgi:hypothetical protein
MWKIEMSVSLGQRWLTPNIEEKGEEEYISNQKKKLLFKYNS